MNAKEFLEHDNIIWKKIDDKNLTKAAMIEFAQTYHESEVKNLDLFSVSNSASGIIEIDTKIQLLPRKWWQIYKRGWQTHTDFFGRKYFVRYNWVK